MPFTPDRGLSLPDLLARVADYTEDVILVTEAEPCDQPGPRILYVNAAFTRTTGYTPEDVVGLTPRILQGPNTSLEARARIRAALEAWQPIRIELLNYRKDGSEFWVELSITPVADETGWFRYWVSVQRETNERRHFDEQRRLYELVLANVNDGIVVSDALRADCPIEFVNAGFTRMTGYAETEVLGRNCRLMQGGNTDRNAIRRLSLAIEQQQPVTVELLNYRKDGSTFWNLISITPLHNAQGEVVKYVGVQRDVTGGKHNERMREQLLEAERAARLESERVAIVKDEFLSTLSHELRTPLAAIVGWANILKRPAVDAETLRRGIDAIARNGNMQARLIDDLLDMNRIVSGKLKMEVGPVDISVVAVEVVDTLRPSADAKGVALEIRLVENAAAQVRGDATRLQQVLSNLMGNAIKFTPSGGVVTMSTDVLPGGSVTLSVKDTGRGIEPRFLPFLFDRFSQADGSAARQHGGLGLGLSIVRRLVELHGGTVTGHSEGTGRGALFVVTLPGATAAAPENPAPTEPFKQPTPVRQPAQRATHFVPRGSEGELSLQGITVLLVDDQPDVLELVRRLLAECGAEVKVAASGASALAMLKDAQPDILLSDIGMPGMDGYELIAQVRGVLALGAAALPAVALTAFTRLKDRSRAFEAGYQAHVEKPIQPALLIQTVLELTAAPAVRKGR